MMHMRPSLVPVVTQIHEYQLVTGLVKAENGKPIECLRWTVNLWHEMITVPAGRLQMRWYVAPSPLTQSILGNPPH